MATHSEIDGNATAGLFAYCGPRSTLFTLQIFGKNTEDISRIGDALEIDPDTGETSMLALKNVLEGQGLHVYPLYLDSTQLERSFDSVVAILRTEREPQLEAIEHPHKSAGHFVVYVKNGSNAYVIDPPFRVQDLGNSEDGGRPLAFLDEEYLYSNQALVVSDVPLTFSSMAANPLPIYCTTIATLLMAYFILHRLRLGPRLLNLITGRESSDAYRRLDK